MQQFLDTSFEFGTGRATRGAICVPLPPVIVTKLFVVVVLLGRIDEKRFLVEIVKKPYFTEFLSHFQAGNTAGD